MVHQLAESPSLAAGVPEQFLYKNRLQEYAQSLGIPLPIYRTVNEGVQHAPRFRSTVAVDGATYMSVFTFSHRKAAEQDVAKLALEHVSKRLVERVDPVFCKSILHEFAAKMKLEKPTYTTTQIESTEPPLPAFVSSLKFDGKNYTGTEGRSKKEAEQMAARAVILSLLGNAEWKAILSQIINSKMKMYAASQKANKPDPRQNATQTLGGLLQSSPVNHLNKGKEVETISATDSQGTPQALLTVKQQPKQESSEVNSVAVGNSIPVLNENLSCGQPVAVSATVANEPQPVIHHDQLIVHDVKLPSDVQGMHLITDNARKRRKKNKKEKETKKPRNVEEEVVKCTTAQSPKSKWLSANLSIRAVEQNSNMELCSVDT
ncbi:hypothetical protein ACLOJK_032383 [Asimina triloba]